MACKICKNPPPTDSNLAFYDKPHTCKICGRTFALKVQLKRHLLSHEGNLTFICEKCEKHPDQQDSYNLRLSKKGNFVCETCNECFVTKRSLLRHAGEHTMENILNCDECGESFKNMSALKRHISLHKQMKNERKSSITASYQCQECGKLFSKINHYQTHCLNHKKYQCNQCNVYFASNKLLQEHLSNGNCHSGNCSDKKHECSLCDKSFSRKSALEGHMVTHFMDNHESPVEDDSDKDVDFQCNQKDDTLCLPKLKIQRSYDCEKCSLVFSSKMSLNKHMSSSHSSSPEQNKTYTCRVCQETFHLKDDYKEHKLMHEPSISLLDKEEKTYSCQICLKMFAKKKHLKKHVKIHLDDVSNTEKSILFSDKKRTKNYSCCYCGKLFAGETCWRKHEAKHDGKEEGVIGKKGKKAKPLVCEYCSADFTGKRSIFVKHKLSHTPEVCGICDERFTDRPSLREHCRIHIGTEEGRRFLECSQRAQDAKNGVAQTEPKVEYIYLVLR